MHVNVCSTTKSSVVSKPVMPPSCRELIAVVQQCAVTTTSTIAGHLPSLPRSGSAGSESAASTAGESSRTRTALKFITPVRISPVACIMYHKTKLLGSCSVYYGVREQSFVCALLVAIAFESFGVLLSGFERLQSVSV